MFLVFHDKGYTAYEPSHCHIEHQVSGAFSMFKLLPEYGTTLPALCPEDGVCSWGDAVNVRNKFIYISQPKLNRIVVIEIQDRSNPVEVSITHLQAPLFNHLPPCCCLPTHTCTDLSDKNLHRKVAVGKVMTSGSTLVQNVRYVALIFALGAIFPIFIFHTTPVAVTMIPYMGCMFGDSTMCICVRSFPVYM